MTKIFVYGTLRQGECRGYTMEEGGTFLREAITEPLYTLKNLGAFPALVKMGGEDMITGEIWEVDDTLLARLDSIEGVASGLYCRENVLLVDHDRGFPVQAYFMKPELAANYPEIKSGDWKRRE